MAQTLLRSLVVGLSVALPTVSLAQTIPDCPCKDILQDGIRDSYNINTKREFLDETERLLRMNDQELEKTSKEKSGKGKLALTIKAVTLGLGGGGSSQTERLKEIRKSLQDDSKRHLSDNEYQDVAVCVANGDIVKAWDHCMSQWIAKLPELAKVDGLVSDFKELTKSDVVMKLQWRKPNDQSPNTVTVADVDLVNLAYGGATKVQKGTAIGAAAIEQRFTRIDPLKESIVIINTEGVGPARYVFPAAKTEFQMASEEEFQKMLVGLKGLNSHERSQAIIKKVLVPTGPAFTGQQYAKLLEGVDGKDRVDAIGAATAYTSMAAMGGRDIGCKLQYPLTAEDYDAILGPLTGKFRGTALEALDAPEKMKQMRELMRRMQPKSDESKSK